MQVETFKDQLYAKLRQKSSPQNDKGLILLQSIENNLNLEQRTNPTAYIAQLINLLKSTKDGQEAIILLIYKILPSVPIVVVRKLIPALLEEIGKVQLDNLSLGVFGQILILSSKDDLNSPKIHQLFNLLLQQTISDKKKLRKQAIKTLQVFYQQKALDIQQVPEINERLRTHFKSNLQENNECAQHSLTLLASLNNLIPYSILVDALYIIIEEIQNMDSKYYPFIFLSLEQVLQQNVGADQAEKLLQQLNQIQPEEVNAQHAYIQCIRQCLLTLSQSSLSLAASYLPSTLSNMAELLLQNNQKLMQHCRLEMMTLIEKIGKATLSIKQDLAEDIMNLELESAGTLQQKYIATLTYLFSNRFDHANILDVFAKFFATIDDKTFEHCKEIVKEFVHNKSRWPHVYFEKTFGQLCVGVSMSNLLRTFPLQTDGVNPLDKDFDEKSNCWILYILSKYANPKLEEFLDFLFPLTNLLSLASNANPSHEQKIIQNILFHVLEIASNSKATNESQHHQKLGQFIELTLNYLKKEHVFFEKLLLMIAKLFSQLVTFPSLQNFAKQYISTLAKLVEQNNCTHTLNGIKVMSFAAPKSYIQEAFKKNIEKLLSSKDKLDDRALNNMDIVLQVVSAQQMTSDLWDYCINFAKEMINIPIIQKKIYKFLGAIMPKVHHTFLSEVYNLVLEAECEPSSRQKRFQVILLLEQFVTPKLDSYQTFIQQFLPEMVVAIRDNNIKTRILAEKLIENIGQRLLGLDLLDQFISMVFAGLAAQSNVMKADAVATISLLVDKFYSNLKGEFIDEMSKLILLLLKEQNNEIFKSIILYVKLFTQLLNVDEVSRDKNIIILKRLLMKLSKAYPSSESLIPQEHIKLYKNAIKIERQQKKKKNKRDQERELNKQKWQEKKQKKQKDSDLESDEESEQELDAKPKQQQGGMETEAEVENNLLLKYDFKKEQFHFEDAIKQKKKVQEKEQQKQSTVQPLVEYKDGKVIVNEQKEVLGQKRRREAVNSDDEEHAQKKITRNDRKTKDVVHVVKESGSTFKSKQKAGGDVTVKGRPEPFAFIQLNPKALNKRFKNQASKAFEEVFSKKSGALKGVKAHK
ncbi:unnamed protein product (macronuclear) [Paramecium tetraurelia]|uniref:Ribosomal RNA-processing protein 12-like conserved domain-containing protein n=1 Tax=Paramecium tetraurelia TaxID=5888 RepID=A0C5F5_PARTE|nr:uncharacterized protein GSPATT00006521001 [Paramecium tetraurelia]CAK66022.1 unnamed protein product [Paramecium tetraurelia]|eukprot:XP_001433419.1 hypothetical protein (macronuclear) [Paramecium tetraurelia strain d4-2]